MRKYFWVVLISTIAYAAPILVCYALTGVADVFFAFIPLLLSLLVFYFGEFGNIQEVTKLKRLNSALALLVFGLIMVVSVLIFPVPELMCLSLVQFFLGFIVYGLG